MSSGTTTPRPARGRPPGVSGLSPDEAFLGSSWNTKQVLSPRGASGGRRPSFATAVTAGAAVAARRRSSQSPRGLRKTVNLAKHGRLMPDPQRRASEDVPFANPLQQAGFDVNEFEGYLEERAHSDREDAEVHAIALTGLSWYDPDTLDVSPLSSPSTPNPFTMPAADGLSGSFNLQRKTSFKLMGHLRRRSSMSRRGSGAAAGGGGGGGGAATSNANRLFRKLRGTIAMTQFVGRMYTGQDAVARSESRYGLAFGRPSDARRLWKANKALAEMGKIKQGMDAFLQTLTDREEERRRNRKQPAIQFVRGDVPASCARLARQEQQEVTAADADDTPPPSEICVEGDGGDGLGNNARSMSTTGLSATPTPTAPVQPLPPRGGGAGGVAGTDSGDGDDGDTGSIRGGDAGGGRTRARRGRAAAHDRPRGGGGQEGRAPADTDDVTSNADPRPLRTGPPAVYHARPWLDGYTGREVSSSHVSYTPFHYEWSARRDVPTALACGGYGMFTYASERKGRVRGESPEGTPQAVAPPATAAAAADTAKPVLFASPMFPKPPPPPPAREARAAPRPRSVASARARSPAPGHVPIWQRHTRATAASARAVRASSGARGMNGDTKTPSAHSRRSKSAGGGTAKRARSAKGGTQAPSAAAAEGARPERAASAAEAEDECGRVGVRDAAVAVVTAAAAAASQDALMQPSAVGSPGDAQGGTEDQTGCAVAGVVAVAPAAAMPDGNARPPAEGDAAPAGKTAPQREEAGCLGTAIPDDPSVAAAVHDSTQAVAAAAAAALAAAVVARPQQGHDAPVYEAERCDDGDAGSNGSPATEGGSGSRSGAASPHPASPSASVATQPMASPRPGVARAVRVGGMPPPPPIPAGGARAGGVGMSPVALSPDSAGVGPASFSAATTYPSSATCDEVNPLHSPLVPAVDTPNILALKERVAQSPVMMDVVTCISGEDSPTAMSPVSGSAATPTAGGGQRRGGTAFDGAAPARDVTVAQGGLVTHRRWRSSVQPDNFRLPGGGGEEDLDPPPEAAVGGDMRTGAAAGGATAAALEAAIDAASSTEGEAGRPLDPDDRQISRDFSAGSSPLSSAAATPTMLPNSLFRAAPGLPTRAAQGKNEAKVDTSSEAEMCV